MPAVLPLGAGQEVGKSCVLVSVGAHTVLFDCGVHLAGPEDRRFPDFAALGDPSQRLAAVVVTHFHLDHCGALPLLTEREGFRGPVYMSHPTRALAAPMLDDFQRVATDAKTGETAFAAEAVARCMARVTGVGARETVRVPGAAGLSLAFFPAGHVLGALSVLATDAATGESAVYTGDVNVGPDRLLPSARLPPLRPDVMVCESTYGDRVHGDDRAQQGARFAAFVAEAAARGGKVLVPVHAVGRAQELSALLDGAGVPLYIAGALAERAGHVFRASAEWCGASAPRAPAQPQPLPRGALDGPAVVFATPGMLVGGASLELFRAWAPDAANAVVFPGHCLAGTVGHRVQSGVTRVDVGKKRIEVRCHVEQLAMSAHADARGLLQLVAQAEPRSVVLVHGDKTPATALRALVERAVGVPSFAPVVGEVVRVPGVGGRGGGKKRRRSSSSSSEGSGDELEVVFVSGAAGAGAAGAAAPGI